MKNFDLKIFCVLILTLFVTEIFGQSRDGRKALSGRTYTTDAPRGDEQRLLMKANAEYRSGDLEAANITLDEAYSASPNSTQILLTRAYYRSLMGMTTEAEADFAKAAVLNPHAADLYGYRGKDNMINVLSSDPAGAKEELNAEQRMNYYYELLDKKVGEEEYDARELELAESAMYDVDTENYAEAVAKTDTLLLEFPESALAYDLRGLIYLKEEKYQKAQAAFKKATELNPEFAIAFYNLGRVEKINGNKTAARAHFDRALELQQDLTKAYFDRALLHKETGEPQKALADYNKIIELKGADYPKAYLNRGLTRKMLGDFAGALQDMNRAIDETEFRKAEPFINRGNLHVLFGYTGAAVQDYTLALEIDENNADAYFNRGLTFITLYETAPGCADLEKSEELGHQEAREMMDYFCEY